MKDNSRKAAAISGTAGVLTTGRALAAVTSSLTGPTAKLGGYATAQIVAKAAGGALGVKLGGPALSAGIAAVGGPLVAGALAATGVGVAAAGLGYLGYIGWKKVFG